MGDSWVRVGFEPMTRRFAAQFANHCPIGAIPSLHLKNMDIYVCAKPCEIVLTPGVFNAFQISNLWMTFIWQAA